MAGLKQREINPASPEARRLAYEENPKLVFASFLFFSLLYRLTSCGQSRFVEHTKIRRLVVQARKTMFPIHRPKSKCRMCPPDFFITPKNSSSPLNLSNLSQTTESRAHSSSGRGAVAHSVSFGSFGQIINPELFAASFSNMSSWYVRVKTYATV